MTEELLSMQKEKVKEIVDELFLSLNKFHGEKLDLIYKSIMIVFLNLSKDMDTEDFKRAIYFLNLGYHEIQQVESDQMAS